MHHIQVFHIVLINSVQFKAPILNSTDPQVLKSNTHFKTVTCTVAFNFGDGHLFKYCENSHLLSGLLQWSTTYIHDSLVVINDAITCTAAVDRTHIALMMQNVAVWSMFNLLNLHVL